MKVACLNTKKVVKVVTASGHTYFFTGNDISQMYRAIWHSMKTADKRHKDYLEKAVTILGSVVYGEVEITK
jgi:hypothetical protein